VIGVHSSFHYAPDLPYAANKNFRERFFAKYGAASIPSSFAVTGYDGMHLAFQMIESQAGQEIRGDSGGRGRQRLQMGEPARTGPDRCGLPRSDRKLLHPPGREGRWQNEETS